MVISEFKLSTLLDWPIYGQRPDFAAVATSVTQPHSH